jgi:hypothetical protein
MPGGAGDVQVDGAGGTGGAPPQTGADAGGAGASPCGGGLVGSGSLGSPGGFCSSLIGMPRCARRARQRPRRRKLLARLRPFGLLAAGLQVAARPARSSECLAALGELVNPQGAFAPLRRQSRRGLPGRAAASSSLVYGPSACSLRACKWRRVLLAHGATGKHAPGNAATGSRRTALARTKDGALFTSVPATPGRAGRREKKGSGGRQSAPASDSPPTSSMIPDAAFEKGRTGIWKQPA